MQQFTDDIDLLESVTGQSFADWRADSSAGSFAGRTA